jgi:hypothetical protein
MVAVPQPSLPGLTQQSICFVKRAVDAKQMDPRVKPGGDANGGGALVQTNS